MEKNKIAIQQILKSSAGPLSHFSDKDLLHVVIQNYLKSELQRWYLSYVLGSLELKLVKRFGWRL